MSDQYVISIEALMVNCGQFDKTLSIGCSLTQNILSLPVWSFRWQGDRRGGWAMLKERFRVAVQNWTLTLTSIGTMFVPAWQVFVLMTERNQIDLGHYERFIIPAEPGAM
jgi:hypothetical protein